MCRMVGLVAAYPIRVVDLLRDAPRSLRQLSNEHADGWGVAIEAGGAAGWQIHRSIACAARCPRFDAVVEGVEARVLIAHVRNKTVGEASLANTHPFQRGRFVFAHNGTVRADALVARSSAARLAEIEGGTDSERLLAFLLTRIDEAGEVGRGVAAAVRELHAIAELGAASFLLSDGGKLYAHRFGRTLFVLDRGDATLVASEPLTGEPWREIAEGGLVVIDERQLAIAA
jgi:predicted glutamine amidotransferase